MKKLFLLLVAIMVSTAILYAQDKNQNCWEIVNQAGGHDVDLGYSITLDDAGNVFIVGRFSGTAHFGKDSITSSGDYDAFLAKYDIKGNILWVRHGGGIDDDRAYSVSVDSKGFIYVGGIISNQAVFDKIKVSSAGSSDAFLAKYDQNGTVQWVKRVGGASEDESSGITVDIYDNIYLTGFFKSTAQFGNFNLTSAGGKDAFICKFDLQGNIIWAEQVSSREDVESYTVACDGAGNVFITGDFKGTLISDNFQMTSLGDFDIFLAKYDKDGNTMWVKQAGGKDYDDVFGVAVDNNGNSYMTGRFTDTVSFGGIYVRSVGNEDMFLAKYDPKGNAIWAKTAGSRGTEIATECTVDGNGNSYVVGIFQSTCYFDKYSITSAGINDIFVAKYDPSGTLIGLVRGGGKDIESAESVTLDKKGGVYFCGELKGNAIFGTKTFTSEGGYDIYWAKLSCIPLPAPAKGK
ncbi:MAG: SBBP repeat-containing protein [Bacteroidales bacterium]|nr:SBBP repeat-containing protein [Bacteroidales bacterium]